VQKGEGEGENGLLPRGGRRPKSEVAELPTQTLDRNDPPPGGRRNQRRGWVPQAIRCRWKEGIHSNEPDEKGSKGERPDSKKEGTENWPGGASHARRPCWLGTRGLTKTKGRRNEN